MSCRLGISHCRSILSWVARSPEAALRGIRRLVAEVAADLEANHESVPEPLHSRCFSGKFTVRVPPEIHRKLALEAAEQGAWSAPGRPRLAGFIATEIARFLVVQDDLEGWLLLPGW